MTVKKLGFIGAGNMAGAMVKGIIESGLYDPKNIYTTDKRKAAAENLVSMYGILSCDDNQSLAKMCRTIVIAVKPQDIGDVLNDIKGILTREHLLISIAAGIPLDMIRAYVGSEVPMARAMPNTPALVQAGMTGICFSVDVPEKKASEAKRLFDAVGKTLVFPESLLDAVTAVSGSGPGYVFRLMECMIHAATDIGFKENEARLMVVETFLGAAMLAERSEKSISELRRMVTSKGGTTEAGLAVMEEKRIDEAIVCAVKAALERGAQIAKRYV